MFKDKLQFSRERLEFWYSILILIAIPVLIIANTLLIANSVRKSYDSELRSKADLSNRLISTAVLPNISDTVVTQATIDDIKSNTEELKSITVAKKVEGKYQAIASTDKQQQSTQLNDIEYTIADNKKQAIATLNNQSGSERFWKVVSPVLVNDEVQAIVATDVSLKKADSDIANALLKSFMIVAVTVSIIVLLLLNHFKFVEYAMLFKKQKEVDQLKNDFLSVATHELKTPMTVLKGNIENLTDGVVGKVDDEAKAVLRTMYNETDRLNGLVNDLLNVSRIEQGRISYTIESVDLVETASEVAKVSAPRAKAKGMTFDLIKPDSKLMISVDKGRLVEICTNLIDNAIKYSKQGTVTISFKQTNKFAQISVRDNGVGISAKDRERLFSRFYRVRNESTKDIAGTGLGLWIIKQYIEQMGGNITVDSIENVGSVFNVEFPLSKLETRDQSVGA